MNTNEEDADWIELLRLAESGDRDAESQLLEKARVRLKAYSQKAGVKSAELSDAVQRTLLRLWELIEKKGVNASVDPEFLSLLKTMAVHDARMAHRDNHRQKRDVSRNQSLHDNVAGDLVTPSTNARRQEEEEIRQSAFESLSEREQQIIRHKKDADMSWSEIGETMSMTEIAARRAYHRAIAKWRENARLQGGSTWKGN